MHSTDSKTTKGIEGRPFRSKPYDIPLRALIARNVDGLMMAGRRISGDFLAHSSYCVNRVSIGSRNGSTFGGWDRNTPKVLAPEPLEERRYYVVAGRMGAGTKTVRIELFINFATPVARKPFPVNPKANASKMAIGQERDTTEHPGKESFDGKIARFLMYDRPLTDDEMRQTFRSLSVRDTIQPRHAGSAESER